MNMKTKALTGLIALSASALYAGITQIGDFRIGATTYAGAHTYFDPGFSETTRAVIGAPVQVNSTFSGTSQNPGGASPDSGTDIGIRTYSSVTQLNNMNRYASSTDGGSSGPARIGIVQWNFNLSPLDSYLSGNGLTLTALDLDLVLDLPGGDGYDVYLSYTDATAGTTLTSISTTNAAANYNDFWWAAENAGATAGSVVNGNFEVLARDQIADGTISDSLLALYNSGAREFNLTLMTPDYNSNQNTSIAEGSGLSITTIPEPATISLVGLVGGLSMLIRRRFYA